MRKLGYDMNVALAFDSWVNLDLVENTTSPRRRSPDPIRDSVVSAALPPKVLGAGTCGDVGQ